MATVYVPGPSLTDAVEDNGPLPVESVLALAAGLAEALQAIHRAGLVHRDLKPSNVLLATDGPRVIDFGISLALERSMMTATGMVMGSPGFMSPEQARGQREVGAPTDMFSFGAVLAYAATGNSPFGVGPTPALLYRVVNEPPDLEAVPARLRPLIEQCLVKDPADRPTPADVLASLSDDVEILTGEWLPQPIAETMVRYVPTLQTPLPPALREPEPASAEAAASAPPAVSGPSGPVGYEPTELGPVVPAAAAADRLPPRGSSTACCRRQPSFPRRARSRPPGRAPPAARAACRPRGRRRRSAGGAGPSRRPPRSSSRWWRCCSRRTRTGPRPRSALPRPRRSPETRRVRRRPRRARRRGRPRSGRRRPSRPGSPRARSRPRRRAAPRRHPRLPPRRRRLPRRRPRPPRPRRRRPRLPPRRPRPSRRRRRHQHAVRAIARSVTLRPGNPGRLAGAGG